MVECLEGSGCPVSIEVEKVGRGYEELIPFGDVVMVSKDVAKYVDHHLKHELVKKSVVPRLRQRSVLQSSE